MAKVTHVADVPELPGAGLLHFDDGRPPLMALPEIADGYRAKLGMGTLENGVAGPGAGDAYRPKEPDVSPAGQYGALAEKYGAPPKPSVRVASPEEWASIQAEKAAQQPAPAPVSGGAPPAPPQVSGAPEPSGNGTAELVAQANEFSRAKAAEELLYGKQTAGSAGRPGGYQPSGQTIKTERGPDYDPMMARDRLDAGDAVLQAQIAQAASQKQQADAMAQHAAAQNLAAQQQVRDQQAEMQRRQQQFQQQDAALQKELADYSDSAKPEPKRFFDSPAGYFSGVLSVIGQGLGAFGASLNHTQNYAFDAAQNQLKMEMAAQEKAYDAGRGDRKNALARLVDYYHGDMDKARLGLSQALNKVAETETLAFGAQSKSKDIASNAQLLAAQFRQQQLLDEQKRVELAAGKSTTETTDKYQQAQGASGGGRKPLTDAEIAARRKIIAGGKGIEPKDERKFEIQYGKAKEDEAGARTSLKTLAEKIGATWDQKTQTWKAPPGGVSVSGHGATGWVPDFLTSQDGREFRRAYLDVLSQTIKLRSGAAATEAEVDRLGKIVGGPYDSDMIGGLNQLQKAQDAAALARDAGYGPDIVDTHNENRRGAVRKAQTNLADAPEEIDEVDE